MRTEAKSTKANNSTLTAPVSELQDILNLSNREIAIRLQSLSLDDLEKLAPLLRVLMYVVLTRESHAAEEHRTNRTFGQVMDYISELEASNRVLSAENNKMRHYFNLELVADVPGSVNTACDILARHANSIRSYITSGLLRLHPDSTDKALKIRLDSVLAFKKAKAEKR